MAPPRRSIASSSAAKSNMSSISSSSSSSLPSYTSTSPAPPAYALGWSPNPIYNRELAPESSTSRTRPSPSLSATTRRSSVGSVSPVPKDMDATEVMPQTPQPRIIDLPDVKYPSPLTYYQSRYHMHNLLFTPNPYLDFRYPPIDFTSLGSATPGVNLSYLPITFDFLPIPTVHYVRSSSTSYVRIHDIAQFIYNFLNTPLSEKDAARYGLVRGQRIINGLGPCTKFGALSLSPMKSEECVWTVKLISS